MLYLLFHPKSMNSDVRINRISIVLDEQNIPQYVLALVLEVSPETVSRWCNNSSQPSAAMFYNIAEALKVNIQTLFVPTSWPSGESAVQVKKKEIERTKISDKKKR